MGPVSALVLFAVIWWMIFFIVLPLRLTTQGDEGEVVEGTHKSSPTDSFSLRRRVRTTTLWAIPVWAVIAGVILTGVVTVRDIDWFDRMSTPEVSREN